MVYTDAALLVRVFCSLRLSMAAKDVHACLGLDDTALLGQAFEQCLTQAGKWIYGSWNRMHLSRLVNHQRCWTAVHAMGKWQEEAM